MSVEPLLTAAKNGYYSQVVSLLSSQSCDVDARDKDKATPLYWSASRGHAKICQALLRAGCDVNASVKWGSTALHAAADRGHADCLAVLLGSGADVQVQNERGDTALHLAAYRGYRDLVERLVGTGRADPFLKNAHSKTPHQEAQSQQHTATAALLQHYAESLGCHPFKSLPVSESSAGGKSSPQERPASSTPAQSWPRFQSYPKFPDPGTPSDQSRPDTHPHLVHNNLSQGGVGGARIPSSQPGRPPSWSEAGSSDFRLSQWTGGIPASTGLKGLPGFAASSQGERLLQPVHVHHDPQEHVDECGVKWGTAKVTQGTRDSRRDRENSNGVRLNQLTRPTGGGSHVAHTVSSPGGHAGHATQSSSSSPVWRPHHNGQDALRGGMSKAVPYETDLHAPPMAPPKHHHSQGYVKHEDLTLFAESLQLEVVNLRDSLSGKERQVSDLETLISSLRAQNTQLQQLVADKHREAKETASCKDSEIEDVWRKLHDTERKNLCLQQAVVEAQTSFQQMLAQREKQVAELTARIGDVERLNTSLQHLLVTQQDTVKGALASKDLEIAVLRDKVVALTQKAVTFPVDSPPLPSSSTSARSVPPPNKPPACGVPSAADSDSMNASAVISACDKTSSNPRVYTDAFQSQTGPTPVVSSDTSENRTRQDRGAPQTFAVTLPRSTGVSPPSSMISPVSKEPERRASSEEGPRQCRLRAAVSRLFFHDPADAGKLDADGREWSVGREFQLLDSRPVNCGSDGQRRGACSLVFSIRHQGRKYMLKVLINLINLSHEGHSQGRSLDAHLLRCFGAEFHAPLLLHPPHPNVVRVRHHYQGDTGHFRHYLDLLVPPTLDVPVDMASRTTFLVLDHYPLTLQTFVDTLWRQEEEEEEEKMKEKSCEPHHHHQKKPQHQKQFMLQLVYQLLSALEYLQRHDVVHRDIKADNVFMDWRLRAVLGDFGLARTLRGGPGPGPGPGSGRGCGSGEVWASASSTAAPFTDGALVLAGNSHAWAPELCRWSRTDPSTLSRPVTLKDIYSKSDGYAMARMFYHLFHRPQNNDDNKNATEDNGDDGKTTTTTTTTSSNATSSNRRSRMSGEEIFPSSTQQQPHYQDSAVPLLPEPVPPGLAHVLRSLVLDDPASRPSVRQALCRVGVLLFKPDVPLTSEEDAEKSCASQLMSLSSSASSATEIRPSQPEEENPLSVAESVAANHNHCLADFLLNFSGRDFWEAYTEMTRLGF